MYECLTDCFQYNNKKTNSWTSVEYNSKRTIEICRESITEIVAYIIKVHQLDIISTAYADSHVECGDDW